MLHRRRRRSDSGDCAKITDELLAGVAAAALASTSADHASSKLCWPTDRTGTRYLVHHLVIFSVNESKAKQFFRAVLLNEVVQ